MEEHDEDVHVLCSVLLRENTNHELDGKVSVPNGERSNYSDNNSSQKYRQTTNGHITLGFCDDIYDKKKKNRKKKSFQSNFPVCHDLKFHILSNGINI
jgi:hypothetical protein